jgi:hypothetical protein
MGRFYLGTDQKMKVYANMPKEVRLNLYQGIEKKSA